MARPLRLLSIRKMKHQRPKTHYLHRDHLDSIVAITNETGHVVDRFFYDAFAKQLTAIDPGGTALYANSKPVSERQDTKER